MAGEKNAEVDIKTKIEAAKKVSTEMAEFDSNLPYGQKYQMTEKRTAENISKIAAFVKTSEETGLNALSYAQIDQLFSGKNINDALALERVQKSFDDIRRLHYGVTYPPYTSKELYFKAKVYQLGTYRQTTTREAQVISGFQGPEEETVVGNGGTVPHLASAIAYRNNFNEIKDKNSEDLEALNKLDGQLNLFIKINHFLSFYLDENEHYNISKPGTAGKYEITQDDINAYNQLSEGEKAAIDSKWKTVNEIYTKRYLTAVEVTQKAADDVMEKMDKLKDKLADNDELHQEDVIASHKRIDLSKGFVNQTGSDVNEFKELVDKYNVYGEYRDKLGVFTPKSVKVNDLSFCIEKLNAYSSLTLNNDAKPTEKVYAPENANKTMKEIASRNRDPIATKFFEFIDSMFKKIGIETSFALSKGAENIREFEKVANPVPTLKSK